MVFYAVPLGNNFPWISFFTSERKSCGASLGHSDMKCTFHLEIISQRIFWLTYCNIVSEGCIISISLVPLFGITPLCFFFVLMLFYELYENVNMRGLLVCFVVNTIFGQLFKHLKLPYSTKSLEILSKISTSEQNAKFLKTF